MSETLGKARPPCKEIAKLLRNEFEILAEGAVTDSNRAMILERVRGGNWQDKSGDGVGEPMHWFACWDSERRLRLIGSLRRSIRISTMEG